MSWPNSINAAFLVNRQSALFIINDMAEGLSQIPATRKPLPAPDMRQLRNIMSVQPIAQPNKYWVPRPAILRRAGMLRTLGLIGTLWTAYELYRQASEFYNSVGPLEGYWPKFDSKFTVSRYSSSCYPEPGMYMGNVSAACDVMQDPTQVGPYNLPVAPIALSPGQNRQFRMYTDEGPATETQNAYRARGQAYSVVYPFELNQPVRYVEFEPQRSEAVAPFIRPPQVAAPAPWLAPVGMRGDAPPRLKPGYSDLRSQPLMPEDVQAGYGDAPERPWPWLMSRPPGPRTRERKLRARNYAAGRAIEYAVGMATEALDWARMLFNALPFWRKMEIINRYRTLEVERGTGAFTAKARLRYVPLDHAQMLKEVYDHIDEISQYELVDGIWTMLAEDRAWAKINQRMGRYQQGPWDQGGPDVRVETEWETFLPWLDPGTVHNRGVLEDAFGQELTDREIERLYAKWERWSSHRPFDPGQLNL